jgi:hypothetical protein
MDAVQVCSGLRESAQVYVLSEIASAIRRSQKRSHEWLCYGPESAPALGRQFFVFADEKN